MNKLRRELGLFDAINIIIGIMIGSGIFFIPTFVFSRAGAPGFALLVWIVAGLISLVSGLCYAELGAAMPKSGGSYVYLKEAFGPIWGFLSTWTGFLVGGPGSIAALAVAFATYANFFLNMPSLGVKLLSIGAVIFLTAINIVGVKQGAWVQKVFTVAKIIPILAIVGFGLVFGTQVEFGPIMPQGSFASTASAFGLALIAALWAFDGWTNVTTIAEEIKKPERNIPRSMIIGIGGVTVLYTLFNIALLRVMPVASIIGSDTPAGDAAKLIFGGIGGLIITGGALISIFGSTNGCVLAFPRQYYAMARDGLFFKQLASIHPRFGTPVASLIISAVLSIVLIMSGTFSQLTTLVIFTGMVFSTMVIAGLFVIRKKRPNLNRPYKAWGYPVVPALVLIINIALLLNTLANDPRSSLLGLVVPVLGIPVYMWFKHKGEYIPEMEFEAAD